MITAERLSSLESMLAGDHHRLECAFQTIVTRAYGGDFQQLESEWSAFQEALLGHLEAEEKHLIPALSRDRPAEAQVLLDDHARIRVQLLQLGFDLDLHCLRAGTVDAFVDALRTHAHREENIFYPWVDRQLAG
jgi:iron-sulfur cluster repair protein YtfE (RIC family)